MTAKLRWGILTTGLIAKELADGVNMSKTGELLAVGSRSQGKADEFAKTYRIPRAYGTYEALLADADVQCIYVATPHPMHAEWTIKACRAGKHVLVEKPIGMNAFEAAAMIDAAKENNVFLMEAFMYRCHPQMEKLRELAASDVVGQVKLIRAQFSYQAPFDPDYRMYGMHLGGGGILDVGCYPASAARLVAGAVVGKRFDDPIEVKAAGHLGKTGIDEWAIASLRFRSGVLAQLTTGINLHDGGSNTVTVFGSEGRIDVPDPWCPSRWNLNPAKILVTRYKDKHTSEVLVPCDRDLYTCEADMVADHVHEKQAPAMTWDDTLGNMRVLDRWRAEIGLVYDIERWENSKATITGSPLPLKSPSPSESSSVRERVAAKPPGEGVGVPVQPVSSLEMQAGPRPHPGPLPKGEGDLSLPRYGRIPGLDKPVSRLVLGCDSISTMPDTAILLDDYFERGGNVFDTSHGYGNPNGACEINLGKWIVSRGVREQVVVIEKGGNPPYVTPQGVDYELRHGLERLGMDRVDLYVIHRDNEQVPIGEWVDLLNRHWKAGRMTRFGVSNFSQARLEAFAAYAKQHDLESFSLVSNQLSLAELHGDLWPGYATVSAGTPGFRAWFEKTQTPLMCWSSQARGFFTDRAGRDKRDEPELVNCWYSEDNFRRRDRAYELARKKNVEPINVALAWVLHQSFPTFPLVGPKRPGETRSCFQALDITLTPGEVRWLNLETDSA